MSRIFSLFALTLCLVSPPAKAQAAGAWRVSGSISGRTFVLDCRLQPSGGACTDVAKNGKSHPLTSFFLNGSQARWGFTTKVMIARIAMSFEGRVDGDRMSGTLRAAGRTGSFTAVRS